ncbi:PEP-CTERM sorting domain-containing protein [Thioalkalivibrio sp. ALJ7]|uniref:PEP-CTERM sorting domain-containing protein n=1 Tax=Thioalkalivibrio sp. ALJ7 TaxID=1158756 RepID=UPI000375D0CA|nr:PEP-CTERM sorting domain-containing protein [Thioalkalivibrio sp. ALJ7]
MSLSKNTLGALAALAMVGLPLSAQAAPITGEEVVSSFDAPSTNALNFAQEVPSREGQVAPYVLVTNFGLDSITLDFFNDSAAPVAFFEVRQDGEVLRTGTPHPVVPDDFIYSGVGVGSFYDMTETSVEFSANDYVEVRLALGGERDWDFDWTRFDVEATEVPLPATLGLFGLGLLALGAARLRRRS